MISSDFPIRLATQADQQAITKLIEQSVRRLALNFYTPEQIEGALKSAWGLDTQLIDDQTYFVVEDSQQIVGAGGWSFRKTLFGNNSEKKRNPEMLNPDNDSAKIRAFFVAPHMARQGIGSLIMENCEQAARKRGFKSLELMSTLPGIALYERHGFKASTPIEYQLEKTLTITFVPMLKKLSASD